MNNTKHVYIRCVYIWFHGVMVNIQDVDSCAPSSNLGGTYVLSFFMPQYICDCRKYSFCPVCLYVGLFVCLSVAKTSTLHITF